MITKQKIKRLEESLKKMNGRRTLYLFKKSDSEELYSDSSNTYNNLDDAKKGMGFKNNDVLLIITGMGFSEYFDKNLAK